jgi:hypothetical protein
MHIMYFNLIYPYIALFYSPPLPLPILFHLSSSVLFCKHDVIYFPLTSTNERKYTILSLWNRLISLNVMISSPILFLVKKKQNLILLYGLVNLHCVYTTYSFVHSSRDGHLRWFQNVAIVNTAVIHMSIQVFLW